MSRYIKRNHSTEIPGNIIFFDTESHETIVPGPDKARRLTLRLWCATRLRIEDGKITRRVSAYGESADSFWSFVDKHSDSQRTTWMFAHNLAFDATMVKFWEKLDNGTFTTAPMYRPLPTGETESAITWRGRIVAERHPTYFCVRQGKRTYKMVDTCNYWPRSLDTIAGQYGLEKVPLPAQWQGNGAFRERCERDVAIIEAIVLDLLHQWRREDCGVFQPTAAGLAYTNWRHMCDVRTPDGKCVDVTTDYIAEAYKLERESYYGGRFQCFYVGPVAGPVYHLDVNSLYPYVMHKYDYPRRFVGYEEDVTHDRLRSLLACYECCARVLVDSREQTFPVRIGGIQYHAYGKFFTSLCGRELQRALESNSIARIHLVQWYSRASIFRRWVDYWYQRKLRASSYRDTRPADYEFCKLILNSLSGKFAQHSRRWVDVPGEFPLEKWGGWPEKDLDTGTWKRKRGLGQITQELLTDGEPPHAVPIISALIACHGREYMREIISQCPVGSVYYMATDSIICNHAALESLHGRGLISDTEIGKFKVKGVHRSAEIFGANHYRLDDIPTCGGLLGKSLSEGRTDRRTEVWDSLPGIVCGGPRDAIVIREVPIDRQLPEHKGIIGRDHWWSPHCLHDSQDWRGGPPQGGYPPDYFPELREVQGSH